MGIRKYAFRFQRKQNERISRVRVSVRQVALKQPGKIYTHIEETNVAACKNEPTNEGMRWGAMRTKWAINAVPADETEKRMALVVEKHVYSVCVRVLCVRWWRKRYFCTCRDRGGVSDETKRKETKTQWRWGRLGELVTDQSGWRGGLTMHVWRTLWYGFRDRFSDLEFFPSPLDQVLFPFPNLRPIGRNAN